MDYMDHMDHMVKSQLKPKVRYTAMGQIVVQTNQAHTNRKKIFFSKDILQSTTFKIKCCLLTSIATNSAPPTQNIGNTNPFDCILDTNCTTNSLNILV